MQADVLKINPNGTLDFDRGWRLHFSMESMAGMIAVTQLHISSRIGNEFSSEPGAVRPLTSIHRQDTRLFSLLFSQQSRLEKAVNAK